MEPAPPDRPPLPTGPHPTIGPGSERMPRWPGWLLVVAGLVIGLGALAAAAVATPGVDDPTLLVGLLLAGAALFVVGLVWLAIRQIRVRRFLPPDRYRGPTVLLLLVLTLVVAGVLTAPFGEDAAALVLGEGEMSPLGAVVLLVSTQVALLAVSWLFVFRPRALVGWPSWAGPDPGGALRAGLGWGVLAWIGSTAALVAAVWLLERVGIAPEPQPAEQALRIIDPWLAVLAIVILAPIAEELFFRGVVFNAWLREGGPRLALFGSSALFGIIHLSLAAVVPIFLLGLALAWIYRRTANLVAPIAMHATVNGISVAVALLARYELLPMPA